MITYYQLLLDFIKPNFVHIMVRDSDLESNLLSNYKLGYLVLKVMLFLYYLLLCSVAMSLQLRTVHP